MAISLSRSLSALLLAATALGGVLSAQAATTYIQADRMVDVVSGKLVEKPALVITDGRITSVGTQGSVAVPDGAARLDLTGMTILPGLIDMHVHLTGRHDMHGYEGLAESTGDETINGVIHAEKTLMAGFTAARNLGAAGYSDVALRRALAANRLNGPRLYVSGPSIGATGGHCDNNLLPPEYDAHSQGAADGPWGVVKKVREVKKYGADLIKICATGGVLSKGTQVGAQQLAQEEMDAIVAEAKRLGLKVAAHAHGTAGIKAAIRAGVDTVEHASFIDDEGIKLAKERGTYLSMDIYNTEYILSAGEAAGFLPESLAKERVVGKTQRESFSRAVKAGVKMVFGSDAGVYPHGDNGKQFSRMVQFGMTPLQAIQAATVNAADALGASADVGTLAVGRYGDLIAVKGDPLADISILEKVDVVVKGGDVVKGKP
ncbi:Xaa-Pro dipeptidase [Niveispirillum cyanobacteriorum]|uniref:Xaa-Pro dipeptidase n=1 Tax=Niveispirillum cyanobacteriorum TaxID=1612173 RepID=A0A2K9N8E0_9PROT|nr:amidohydrolase family protein [Niveispirillum cyanobacteriorum]AUN29413.1 Xaa-Pro dipeptidase [Niveispirillum cyanobacteriorum]GGE64309.1 Xaa-Pro dipeptidase [Niveispirillum cyanobacteriorum]